MGRQGIKVQVQAIAGEQGQTAWSKALSKRVDHQVGHVLRAGTELEHRQNFGARINRHPQPLHLRTATQPRS